MQYKTSIFPNDEVGFVKKHYDYLPTISIDIIHLIAFGILIWFILFAFKWLKADKYDQ